MFTGLVQGQARLLKLTQEGPTRTLQLELGELAKDLVLGASVAVDGVCLTLTALEGSRASFDVISETLQRTHFKNLRLGQLLNIERSLRIGDEIGGHFVSGHVFGVAKVLSRDGGSFLLEAPSGAARYLFCKGFVAPNGVSLTLGEVNGPHFAVHLIPETLARTNLAELAAGDLLNFEADTQTMTLVESVERILAQKGLT